MSKKETSSDFRKILERMTHKHDTRRVFDGFVRCAACAVAAQTREPEYMEEIRRWEKPDLEDFSKALACLVIEMESRPFEDVLGSYYMEFALSTKGQQWNGEFHTPKSICDLMARLTMGDSTIPAEGPITVCEPACGAGAMILSIAEAMAPEDRRRLRVTAIDINRTACDMAFINTTLWGIPTRVIHGNTLSLECWAAWSNIHHIMPWLGLAMATEKISEQGQPPKPAEIIQLRHAIAQQTEMAFG